MMHTVATSGRDRERLQAMARWFTLFQVVFGLLMAFSTSLEGSVEGEASCSSSSGYSGKPISLAS